MTTARTQHQPDPSNRIRGTVKWFNAAKGYGFIARQDGPDVFVHHTGIDASGYRELKEGQLVEFEIVSSDKGPKAENVVVVGA